MILLFQIPGERTQLCCPKDAIDPPLENAPNIPDQNECTNVLSGGESSCELYNKCSPFLQLISNLKRPFPKSLPTLMRSSFMCGFDKIGGFSVPKICCPQDALITTTSTTTSTTTTTTTTSTPSKDK